MIRVAAIGDLHVEPGAAGRLRPLYQRAATEADLLLLAGDLTETGEIAQAEELCDVFRGLDVPVVAVLGNHDYHEGHQTKIRALLTDAGVTVLEGEATTLETRGVRIGVAGIKGSAGGFSGRAVHHFGEEEMKTWATRVADTAAALGAAIERITDADVRIVLTHYAPVRDTLVGEPRELYVFLGSYLLAEVMDAVAPGPTSTGAGRAARGPDGAPSIALAVHGHAHYGSELGVTPGGVPVRNVAGAVIGVPYAIYELPGATRVN